MPVVRISGQLIYFAHVPKCAGTAVERYLQMRFGPLGLRNPEYLDLPEPLRWTRTSPQHVDTAALNRLIPFSFFDAGFALVRHPAARLRSVFLFQRDIEQALPPDADFGEWVDALPGLMRANPFLLDNHVRPMTEMVPDGCAVFRLEEGLDQVLDWLDEIAGADDGPREIRFANSYSAVLMHRELKPGPRPEMTPAVLHRIAEIYASDFTRFGYDLSDGKAQPDRAAAGTK